MEHRICYKEDGITKERRARFKNMSSELKMMEDEIRGMLENEAIDVESSIVDAFD